MNPNLPLSDIHPISSEMRQLFLQQGSLRVPGLCSAREMAFYSEVIEDAFWRAHGPPMRPDGSDRLPLTVFDLWLQDSQVAPFVLSRRFARIAAELLGVSSIRLWSQTTQFTESGGTALDWHQASDSVEALVQLWMPLHLVTADMMGPMIAWGSHENGLREVPNNPQREFALQIAEERRSTQQIQEMAPGDAIFIHGHTLQGLPSNFSRWTREAMLISWVDGSLPLDDERHPIVFSEI